MIYVIMFFSGVFIGVYLEKVIQELREIYKEDSR